MGRMGAQHILSFFFGPPQDRKEKLPLLLQVFFCQFSGETVWGLRGRILRVYKRPIPFRQDRLRD